MPSLRKYPRLPPRAQAKLVTPERALLLTFAGLVGLGMSQPALLTVADNTNFGVPGTSNTQIATRGSVPASIPDADFTPVGSIESTFHNATEALHVMPPLGLRKSKAD